MTTNISLGNLGLLCNGWYFPVLLILGLRLHQVLAEEDGLLNEGHLLKW